VASSEPNRNIRWEIYPSEIVSSLQVYKSQSADLISGGVAGTIDLRTISPLDYVGETFVVRAGPTYYETAEDIPDYSAWGFRGSASLVGKFSPVFWRACTTARRRWTMRCMHCRRTCRAPWTRRS
jgi:hypothetical protein